MSHNETVAVAETGKKSIKMWAEEDDYDIEDAALKTLW